MFTLGYWYVYIRLLIYLQFFFYFVRYEPIKPDELLQSANKAGIIVNAKEIAQFLDSQSITYSTPWKQNNRKDKGKRRRKKIDGR